MKNQRNKKLALNTFMSLSHQVTTIVCGFILPRFILNAFGSDVNGVVDSITQFLAVISFLELGVGSVVQSSLYKPLAEKDNFSVSRIMRSANNFFRKLAAIMLAYVVVLTIIYPLFVDDQFGNVYTSALVLIISLSSFSQYYFGITNRLLLNADQKGYIAHLTQIIAIILNTLLCVILIRFGCSIHIVKLTTSLIYFIQPIILHIYVRKHYSVDNNIKYDVEPIKQKWNGMAQHVSAVVLDGTDIIVLTLFSSLANVSIYSVYNIVVRGLKNLVHATMGGVTSLIGELWAKRETEKMQQVFGWMQWAVHTVTTFVFGVTAVLLTPFISVYTDGISDACYYQPVFAVLITLANAGYCLRLPYSAMVIAVGHYKQTQRNYIIGATLNIVISIATVRVFGLIGVAVGTIVAMFYQTIWMAIYSYKNLLRLPISIFVKQICMDLGSMALIYCLTFWIPMASNTYFSWVMLAIQVSVIALVIVFGVNVLFARNRLQMLAKKFYSVIKKV